MEDTNNGNGNGLVRKLKAELTTTNIVLIVSLIVTGSMQWAGFGQARELSKETSTLLRNHELDSKIHVDPRLMDEMLKRQSMLEVKMDQILRELRRQ